VDAATHSPASSQGLRFNETIDCIWDLLNAIESQRSIAAGLDEFLARGHRGDLAAAVMTLLMEHRQAGRAQRVAEEIEGGLTPTQCALARLIVLGLSGHPVRKALVHIKDEALEKLEAELQAHCSRLPFLSLLPLFLLQMPAFLMVTLVPFVRNLSSQLLAGGSAP
jgi:hypothetical protein